MYQRRVPNRAFLHAGSHYFQCACLHFTQPGNATARPSVYGVEGSILIDKEQVYADVLATWRRGSDYELFSCAGIAYHIGPGSLNSLPYSQP